jgi:predicted flap endonuclease-1-like 5' DNA nuclease
MNHMCSFLATLVGLPLAQEAEAEGIPWWASVLIALVLLAFAAYVIWWWLNRKGEPEVAVPHHAEEVEHPAVAAAGVDLSEPAVPDLKSAEAELPGAVASDEDLPQVEARAAAIPVVPDDLTKIEGIGPKIAGVLNAAGITTFGQLAGADPEHLRQILGSADPRLLRLADPATWPEQARLAAAGDWDALRALLATLKGGQRS